MSLDCRSCKVEMKESVEKTKEGHMVNYECQECGHKESLEYAKKEKPNETNTD